MANTAIVRLQTIGTNPATYQDLFPMASSTVLGNGSGRFVTANAGVYALTTGSNTQIDGIIDDTYSIASTTQGVSPLTTSATSGGSVLTGTKEIHDSSSLYWLPVKAGVAAVAATDVEIQCDLDVTANFQAVDKLTTTRKHVQIMAVDVANQLVLVRALV